MDGRYRWYMDSYAIQRYNSMLFIFCCFELLRALGRARQPEPQNDLYNFQYPNDDFPNRNVILDSKFYGWKLSNHRKMNTRTTTSKSSKAFWNKKKNIWKTDIWRKQKNSLIDKVWQIELKRECPTRKWEGERNTSHEY